MNADTEIKLIVKSLNALGQSIGVETVFRDWCECSALTIANSIDVFHGSLWELREKRYLDVIARYKVFHWSRRLLGRPHLHGVLWRQ